MPLEGKSAQQKWQNNSPLAADMIAAGNFDLAMHLLSRQIGVVNFAVLKPYFMTIWSAAQCQLPQLTGTESYTVPLQRNSGDTKDDKVVDLPELGYKLANCVDTLKNAYKAVTDGNITEALAFFQEIIHTLPILVVDKKGQQQEVMELLEICREYITAMRLEVTRKDLTDVARQSALSAYFTRCRLQPAHSLIGLRVAIKCTYTAKNYKACAGFCHRVLELCVTSAKSNLAKNVNVGQIKGVLKSCEAKNAENIDLAYNDSDVFVLCCESFTPITKGQAAVRCPYCKSMYKDSYSGQLCKTCQLSKIGAEATGLRCFAE